MNSQSRSGNKKKKELLEKLTLYFKVFKKNVQVSCFNLYILFKEKGKEEVVKRRRE